MDTFDPQMAQRVWQRVRSVQQPEDEAAGLPALIAENLEASAAYLQLARRFSGRHNATLRRLSEESLAHAACLKGIYTLLTEEFAAIDAPAVAGATTLALLRLCCGKALGRLRRYEQWAAHDEFGPVFALLARQLQEHCKALPELLGSLGK